MPAFKVHLSNGNSYVTQMAIGTTLAAAIHYFLGKWFNHGQGGEDLMLKVTKVEKV
jgi:hypothetical protein